MIDGAGARVILKLHILHAAEASPVNAHTPSSRFEPAGFERRLGLTILALSLVGLLLNFLE
jgi:hypothetical protein